MDDRPFDAPNLLRHAAGRLHGFPDISEDLLDAADEIERLRTENAAFRNAIRVGDGPSCEDVCLVECVGVCGITFEENPC